MLVPCEKCQRDGTDSSGVCSNCNGWGWLTMWVTPCPDCYGQQPQVRWSGSRPVTEECKTCEGKKFVEHLRAIDADPVVVPVRDLIEIEAMLTQVLQNREEGEGAFTIDEAVDSALAEGKVPISRPDMTQERLVGIVVGLLVHQNDRFLKGSRPQQLFRSLAEEGGDVVITPTAIWHRTDDAATVLVRTVGGD